MAGLAAPAAPAQFYPRVTILERDALPGVRIRDGVDVLGPLTSDPQHVTGVAVSTAGGTEGIDADLVVDAAGKASRLPQWLTELGYPAPDEDLDRLARAHRSGGAAAEPGCRVTSCHSCRVSAYSTSPSSSPGMG